jgi:prepilin-type processing-associated H-X9-DG protein
VTTPTNDPERNYTPNPLNYGLPTAKKSTSALTGIFIALLVSLLMLCGVRLLSLPRPYVARPVSNLVISASNLRQIGQAIAIYANDNNHQFPKDFATLLTTTDIPADVFVCPGSSDTPAAGPTTQAVVADFAKPGHCSYLYFGADMRDTDNPQTVVAAEPLANHHGQGVNVLFLDGHVDWIVAPAAQKLIAAATTQSTIWPPPGGE